MAKASRKFVENFGAWVDHKINIGQFTQEDADTLKADIRKDLEPGPDLLRDGLTVRNQAGVEVPAAINDHNERYRLWDEFFASELAAISESTCEVLV